MEVLTREAFLHTEFDGPGLGDGSGCGLGNNSGYGLGNGSGPDTLTALDTVMAIAEETGQDRALATALAMATATDMATATVATQV